ncbi:hypothetical protein CSW98_12460 [Vibrio sp. HA2012]|uniref:hypothetical protein n=1 Tax=Vibrio sp. HA2012 TaxID=1971595 RepID=UPI000C2BF498|nr:hypothetical protein [Vibrio sp. HA2012]PJC85863.1 hypothetical protein CSW98_12460 [Vibrio sp. HA2012]
MAQQDYHDRRQCIRLRYPHTERPTIELMGHEYPVCEISEKGMRLLFRSSDPVSLGVTLSGVVHFMNKEDVPIEGMALRQHASEVAMKLTKGISSERIDEEQKYLNQ